MFAIGPVRLLSLLQHPKSYLALCHFPALSPPGEAAQGTYDGLFKLACEGDRAAVLPWFTKEAVHHPLTRNEAADWLQIVGWANQDKQVTLIWQGYSFNTFPVQARVTVANLPFSLCGRKHATRLSCG